jgi:hypothetical protein
VWWYILSPQLHRRLRLEGLQFQLGLGKKFQGSHFNRKNWVWWHMPVISATAKSISWRIVVAGKK